MKNLKIIILFLFIICENSLAQTLTKKNLDDLRGWTISSCFRAQRANEINRGIIKDSDIKSYCACHAQTLFPAHTTVNEVRQALEIQKKYGDKAMLDFLLKGRDLYEISDNCRKKR